MLLIKKEKSTLCGDFEAAGIRGVRDGVVGGALAATAFG
jgi:hypothetical protein